MTRLKIEPRDADEPMPTRIRLMISACFVLAALVIGFGASAAIYQFNRERIQSSAFLGALVCGEKLYIGDAPTRSGIRMVCRDKAGVEVSERNNLVAIKMALPFILLASIPFQYVAWRVRFVRARRF